MHNHWAVQGEENGKWSTYQKISEDCVFLAVFKVKEDAERFIRLKNLSHRHNRIVKLVVEE